MNRKVHTENAPAAIGPYSQAVVVGDLVFCSGQIPLDPETGALVGSGITEQTHRVCQNLKAVLEAVGAYLDAGYRTADIMGEGMKQVGCAECGRLITENLRKE